MQLPKTNKDDTRPKNAILPIYSFIHSNAYHLGMSKNHVYFNFPVLAYNDTWSIPYNPNETLHLLIHKNQYVRNIMLHAYQKIFSSFDWCIRYWSILHLRKLSFLTLYLWLTKRKFSFKTLVNAKIVNAE